jgi:hypothetical protein
MSKRSRRRARDLEQQKQAPTVPAGVISIPVGQADSASGASKHEINASLKAIYGGKPGKDLLAVMDRGRQRTWLMVLVAFVVLLGLVTTAAWIGFWWWGSRTSVQGGLKITIEGPSQISLGSETSYFINWQNVSKQPLASAEVRVSFPNDFVLNTIEPKPLSTSDAGTNQPLIFRLGSQSVEGRGTIKVTGTFTGALGTKSAVQVIATYRPASFNSDFEELATQELSYTDTVLTGELALPPKVLPGDRVTIVYRLLNKGTDPMKGLEAHIKLPETFVRDATGSGALLDGNVAVLPVETLAPGASSTVRVSGTFAIGTNGDAAVQAEAGRVSPDGSFAAAQRTEGKISVLAGDLSVKLVVNGSDQDRSVALGERQRVAVSYENTSGEELHGVILRFHLGGDPAATSTAKATGTIDLIDWKQLDDSTVGRRDHDTLTYGKEQIGQLERLPAGANGLIELSVPLVTTVTTTRDVSILAYVEATIGAVDKTVVNRTVKTQPIRMKIQTDAALTSIARYSSEEGAPLGQGPLPPRVGTSTRYRIEWDVTKTLHALERITVSAELPKNVAWGGTKEVGAGDMSYDDARRLVSWTVNKMPQDIKELTASFDVLLTPYESDVGRFADLLNETRMEFTDSNVTESLLRSAHSLNTDLPSDEMAKGKGVVRK